MNFRSTRAANPGEPPSLGIWSQHGRDKNDTSDLRYHDAVDGTFTQMEELTIQMSRFVIRSLTKIGQNPPPNRKDIIKRNRIRIRSRKEGTNPCKGEAKPPPKVSPPWVNPPFFRQSTQRFTKGSGWVEPRDCARAREEGPASPVKAKAKLLMMSFLIESPQRTGRELTDRKQVLKS